MESYEWDIRGRDFERAVAAMMRSGMAASEVDRALGVPRGSAHDAAVRVWRRDREAHELPLIAVAECDPEGTM